MANSEISLNVDGLIDEGKWTSFQTITVGMCAAVTVIDGFDTQAIAYVAPVLAKSWGLGPVSFGPVFSVGLVGMMVGALALGSISDRYGRKLAIIASVICMGVFSIATVFATSIDALLVLRFMTGLGLGGAMPNVIALSAEYTPARLRSTAIGVMFCGFPLGAVLGGLLAAQAIPAFGWQSVFLIGGVVPLVFAIILLIALPESVRYVAAKSGRQDEVARLLSRAVPGAHIPSGARFHTTEIASASRGAALAELFGADRIVGTIMLWAAFFMNLLMYYFLINWLPLTLQQAGIALSHAILFTALLNAGGIVGTIVLARVIDRAGSFRILWAVLLAAAFAIAAVGYLGKEGSVVLAIAIFAAGFCVNGAQNNMNALAAGLYTTPVRATGVGFALGIGRIGSILGPLVGGILLSAHMPLETLFTIGALPALVGAAAMWVLTRQKRHRLAPATGSSA